MMHNPHLCINAMLVKQSITAYKVLAKNARSLLSLNKIDDCKYEFEMIN